MMCSTLSYPYLIFKIAHPLYSTFPFECKYSYFIALFKSTPIVCWCKTETKYHQQYSIEVQDFHTGSWRSYCIGLDSEMFFWNLKQCLDVDFLNDFHVILGKHNREIWMHRRSSERRIKQGKRERNEESKVYIFSPTECLYINA
jgi:hypothetical protein